VTLNSKSLTKVVDIDKGVVDMSIVLVCWNNKQYLDPCLESLFRDELNCTFDVVVVDNGSTDGSQEMLQEKYPEVMLIQNSKNEGLSRASNQGIEATNGKYVLLLNNDTIVNAPSLDSMVTFLDENPKVGAVGCKLLNADGTTQSCYNHFSTYWEEILIATRVGELFRPGYPSIVDADERKSVDWMSSACLLLRRSALDQVGLLDEEYFIYGDEADLQYRIKKAGWEIWYLPEAKIIHYGGRSMDRWPRRKMVYRGKMLFYQKNYGAFQSFLLRIMLAILSLLKVIVWSFVFLIPSMRDQAKKELRSNIEVIQLCINLK
jgi:N-acetylglucosaminyl-diphospho-decaprenol L-rhamnosyltransferase